MMLAHLLRVGISSIELNLNILLLEKPSDSMMFTISFGRWLTMYVSQAFALRLNCCYIGLINLVEIALMHMRNTIAVLTTILLNHELRG